MGFKKALIIFVLATMVTIELVPSPIVGDTTGNEDDEVAGSTDPSIARSGSDDIIASTEPLSPTVDESGSKVQLFFEAETLRPTAPTNGSGDQQTMCPGRSWGGRYIGQRCGIWNLPVSTATTVTGVEMRLWAVSQVGAKNAHFQVQLFRNGGSGQTFSSNTQTLGQAPIEYTIAAQGRYTQQFNEGDVLNVYVFWFADPKGPIGPSGGSTFLYGSSEHPSRVILNFNPHPVNITNITIPAVNKDTCQIEAAFKDGLGADATFMTYAIVITGPVSATPKSLSEPSASSGTSNLSRVSWTWTHKNDRAPKGTYSIQVMISYDGNTSVSGTFQVEILIPSSGGGGKNLFDLGGLTTGGFNTWVILFIIIIIVIIAALAIRRRRRRMREQYNEEYYDEDGYDDDYADEELADDEDYGGPP